ncbi:uncharacterized protein [Engystomops pustulosus]|uniref:uncharacterized protein n=1 Tax=Engystomops pustulosus TaxID=76066 RepID=UPI003AFA12C8
MDKIQKREQYKTQLLRKMEKNWRKNDLQLLSQMRRERSQKLQPIEEIKKPLSRMIADSGDASSYSYSRTSVQKEKTVSVSGSTASVSKKDTNVLPLITSKTSLLKSDSPEQDQHSLADLLSSIQHNDYSQFVQVEETVFESETSKDISISSTISSSMKTVIKPDLSTYDPEYFKETYSLMFQKVFEEQSEYLSSVSENLVEIVFNKITSTAPGHHIGFTPIKTVAKETWQDIRGKSPCKYLISRLEVMSTASEIVENVLRKWQDIAVQKFSTQYQEIFEEQTSFKQLYKFFTCTNNQEEMYKATLPIATESIKESSEEIVKIVLAHLENFANSRSVMPLKQQSDSAVAVSLKHISSMNVSTDVSDALETKLGDIFRPHEQPQIFLKKELENLATSIKHPEHKVLLIIQEFIQTILNIVKATIEYDKRQETEQKIAISAQEKFLVYKYLESNYKPSQKGLPRRYSRMLLLPNIHESNMGRDSASHSGNQVLRAVIEEVNVPGMVRCLEDEDENKKRPCRGYYENASVVSQPLGNQDMLENNCFLLNMFKSNHLMLSQNEFKHPIKFIDELVTDTLIKILIDIKYPIPEHLFGFSEFTNNRYDNDSALKYPNNFNALLLPSDIRSFSHHLIEYILKMLYATSSYEKWKKTFLAIFSQVGAEQNTHEITDCNQPLSPSHFDPTPEHNIWEEMAQTLSAKMESFLLLKFKTYLTPGHIVDTDLLRTVPEIYTDLEVYSKGIITTVLDKISESITQQQTHDQLKPLYGLYSNDDTSITLVLISSLLHRMSNEQFNVCSEEWSTSTSRECLDSGCALHKLYDKTIDAYIDNSRLQNIVSSALKEVLKQIMDKIQVKSQKCASLQSTPISIETDLSKCCQDSVNFLQTEINVISKCILEDLINILCNVKQKLKGNKSSFTYQGSITGICENAVETIGNSVLRDVFQKLRRFTSLALKAIHPSSKNIPEEIYFPGMFDQHHLNYGPAEDPNRKLRSTRPKSNLYRYAKHLSHEILCVIQSQLENISNNIRQSILEDVTSESNSLLVFEVEKMSLLSKDKSITFPQDTSIMQKIENNIKRNSIQNLCVHLKGKESVTPEIASTVRKVIMIVFKQLLVDLSGPLNLTHFSQICDIHQQLLSENVLTCGHYADSCPFSDFEIIDLSADILKILSDVIYASNGSELHDQTSSSNGDILDGVKFINPVLTKLINVVISKIIALFRLSIQEPQQSESKKSISVDRNLECYAQGLADCILHQAEEHLREQIKDVHDSFLPPSNSDIANHIVSVLLESLKNTFQNKEETNTLPSSGNEGIQEKNVSCNATEIAKMVEIIIRDTINNLTTINLSDITLDICAKNLASSVLTLIQKELEENRFIDKNAVATEIVNIILQKFHVEGISYENNLTNARNDVDSTSTHTLTYETTSNSLSSSCQEPELSILIHLVECVLHEVQTIIVLELKLPIIDNQPNERLPENLCETCLGFTRSDIEFVAKDIVDIIIEKLSKHLQDILCYPNLLYEEHCPFMLLEPEDSTFFQTNTCFHNQNDRTNYLDESYVEDCLLSHQLISAVSDKTAAFAAAVALKCKPYLPGDLKDENIGTFLTHVNNTSLDLESYAKNIVMKVIENIKPRSKRKLLNMQNMTEDEDYQVTQLVDNILGELDFRYESSSIVSEEASLDNESTKSNTENGGTVGHPTASTPVQSSSSSADEQRWFRVTGVVSLTNSKTESDFENGEYVNHPEVHTSRLPSSSKKVMEQRRLGGAGVILATSSYTDSDFENGEVIDHPTASTPKPPQSSSNVNEQIRFLSPSCSNTESETEIGEAGLLPQSLIERPSSSSSPTVDEKQSYNIRLNFL